MKPAPFAYHRPASVEEALACLGKEGPRSQVLAGGQSLLAMLNRRELRPVALVDLGAIQSLNYTDFDGDSLRIGALTTHAEIEAIADPVIRAAYLVLPASAALIGHPPVRCRGTFGGSLAHADPASEWCLLAVLLDAQIVVAGPAGSRVVAAEDFFLGPHRTALAWNEILIEVRLPAPAAAAALVEFSLQQGDLAVVAAASDVALNDAGDVTSARIALGGVADRPVRIGTAERLLLGSRLTERDIADAARAAASDLDPPGDIRADSRYRSELAEVLVARSLRESLSLLEANRFSQQKAGTP